MQALQVPVKRESPQIKFVIKLFSSSREVLEVWLCPPPGKGLQTREKNKTKTSHQKASNKIHKRPTQTPSTLTPAVSDTINLRIAYSSTENSFFSKFLNKASQSCVLVFKRWGKIMHSRSLFFLPC